MFQRSVVFFLDACLFCCKVESCRQKASHERGIVCTSWSCIPLLGTILSPFKSTKEDDVPFPPEGYVSSLEGNYSVLRV